MYVFDRRRFVRGPDLLAPEASTTTWTSKMPIIMAQCTKMESIGSTGLIMPNMMDLLLPIVSVLECWPLF